MEMAGRLLCFECYRARLDRPERLRMPIVTFPRLLTQREVAHRRQMLAHLASHFDSLYSVGESTDRASGPPQSA
jgi:hypothetical protein